MRHTATILFLISMNLVLSAQTSIEDINKCVISYKGDSTLLIEKYEIDINKEKVFYITPIMNYLDIKGEKYRTPIKIKKQEWKEILLCIDSLYNFNSKITDNIGDKEIIYSVEYFNSSEKIQTFTFYDDSIPKDLKRLFIIMRDDD